MSLFDLSRVWDVFPQLTGSQVLRSLFRQAPTHASEEKVLEVFMTRSHLLVATQTDEAGGNALYNFSVCSSEETADCSLPMTPGWGPVVTVGCLENEDDVWVVRDRGLIEIFYQQNNSWTLRGAAKLTDSSATDDVCVASCAWHSASHYLVYCTGIHEQPDDHTHQVHACSYHLAVGGQSEGLHLERSTLLLAACPAMSLWSWAGGVGLQPQEGPPGLLLLWSSHHPTQLLPFILNRQSHGLPSPPPSHYPTLCLKLAALWTTAPKDPWLLSITVAMTTGQLLLLLSSGEVVAMETNQCGCSSRCLLKDFAIRYSLPESRHAELQLVTIQTYYGIFCKGQLRMYESQCGELVWENDEYEGHDITLLAPPTSQHWVGIYGNSGVWLLCSHRLSEHTQLLSQALFPVTTNADETTPGDYLEEGWVMAASLCMLWGLPLPATRCALEALHSLVQRDQSGGDELFLPHLGPELRAVLDNTSLQSPALLVALLTEYPRYMQLTDRAVQAFLNDLHDDSATPLTKEIAPLLRQYHDLCQDYTKQLAEGRTGIARQLLPSPSVTATSLLHRLEGCHDNSRVCLRAELQMLSCNYPTAVLAGIREYLAESNFNSAVTQLERGEWHSDKDWKTLLAPERGTGLDKGVLGVGPNIPLFELTCRLLYSEQPSELVNFVIFAQLARDCQVQGATSFARKCRKTYFCQRALQCLPQFVSPEVTPTSREALLAHSLLLFQSECNGCECSSLRLLVRGRLWEDALSFVEQQATNVPHIYCTLFNSLLTAMAEESVLQCYIDRIWQILPQTFSMFDFLCVLSHIPADSPSLLLHNHTSLTVTDIRDKLQHMLQTHS